MIKNFLILGSRLHAISRFKKSFAANVSREARSFTIAANWYPTAYIKYYATFERTVFDGSPSGPRPAENVILVRAQLGF